MRRQVTRRAPVRAAISGGLTAATAVSLASVAYLDLILIAAAWPRKPVDAPPRTAARLDVAILVPAHDEAGGIGRTLTTLTGQDYPDDDLEIIVIADNCTDDTAAVARRHGVSVWEREDLENRGKGHALSWALNRLQSREQNVDVVAFVDADCQASANFVTEVTDAIASGASAVQVAYRVGNATASTESALRSAGFALMHDVRASGKTALGLSAGLFGTGMAFVTSVLRDVPWNGAAVTEDTDYHLRLVRSGHVVRYAPDAEVRSDMPTTAAAARDQHLRWEGGNASVARNEALGLLASGVRRLDTQLIHVAVERLILPQSLLVLLSTSAFGGSIAMNNTRRAKLGALAMAGQGAYVLMGLRVARVPGETWRALTHAPGLVARRLALAAGIARFGGPIEWKRTERAQA